MVAWVGVVPAAGPPPDYALRLAQVRAMNDVVDGAPRPFLVAAALRIRVDDEWIEGEYRYVQVAEDRWRMQLLVPGYAEDRGRAGDRRWKERTSQIRPYLALRALQAVRWYSALPDEEARTEVERVRTRRGEECADLAAEDTRICFDAETLALRRIEKERSEPDLRWSLEAGESRSFGAIRYPATVELQVRKTPIVTAEIGIAAVPEDTPAIAPPEGATLEEACDAWTDPVAVRRVAPEYPEMARKLRVDGAVYVATRVASDGRVLDAYAFHGSPLLVMAAAEAVSRWSFRPATCNGRPVESERLVRVHFGLY